MKTLKILAITCIIGLFLQVFAHINLMVSYKYEVDLMETNIKTDGNISNQERLKRTEEMEQRKQEILHQQIVVKVLFWFFLLGLIILIYLILNKRTPSVNSGSE